MKKILLILSIIYAPFVIAQQTNFAKYIGNKSAKLFIPTQNISLNKSNTLAKINLDFSSVAKQYLLDNIKELQIGNCDLKLTNTYQSIVGTHYQFIQTYNGSEIYQSNIKIALNNQGEIINIINDLVDLRNKNVPSNFLKNNEFWAFDGTELTASKKSILGNKEQLFTIENELIYENIKSLKKGKTDTSVTVKIFNPDPLTTARSEYVAPYLNYNKLDTPSLNNERKDLLLSLKMDSAGNYLAENKYVLVKDIFAPNVAPFATKYKDSLIVTRNTDIFKQEMALYHIKHFQEYIQSLGFTNIQNQLWVDPLGDFGEGSRFEFSDQDPYLILGIGGIPDAEDADVIIHEYGHATAFYIAPNTVDGEERIGIDEGNSDILAVIYSRKLSDFNWRKVFNWDGNQTWNGRTTFNSKNYVDDFVLERYGLSAIWSGAVTDFAEQIGLDTTVTLLLTAMASMQSNMKIPEFAKLFIQADSLLYNKYHYATIKNSFFNRKFIPSVSIDEVFDASLIKLINSAEFAYSNEPLTIQVPSNEKYQVTVYNLQGKQILAFDNQQHSTIINSDLLSEGMYILNIAGGNKNFNFKIAKY
ncbi:MAG: T9SS type A sorting domain-containing protein [Bacteroidia bacterium]|nr:T9SS type A sorting domain-containing protein [Bacteroidia bacterium]